MGFLNFILRPARTVLGVSCAHGEGAVEDKCSLRP